MYRLKGVLGRSEIDQVLSMIRRGRFLDGAGSAGGAARDVKKNEEAGFGGEDQRAFTRFVFNALGRHPEFARTVMPVELSAPMVNRYAAGMTYGDHYDAPLMSTPDGPKMRCDLSATLFLMDPASYDGGELCTTKYGHTEAVKLGAGDLFIYSAGTLHHVAPVTRGERLAVVFWIQSMVRDHEKRAMLASLDGVVAKLGEIAPGSEALREATGVFTNLVRLWADP